MTNDETSDCLGMHRLSDSLRNSNPNDLGQRVGSHGSLIDPLFPELVGKEVRFDVPGIPPRIGTYRGETQEGYHIIQPTVVFQNYGNEIAISSLPGYVVLGSSSPIHLGATLEEYVRGYNRQLAQTQAEKTAARVQGLMQEGPVRYIRSKKL